MRASLLVSVACGLLWLSGAVAAAAPGRERAAEQAPDRQRSAEQAPHPPRAAKQVPNPQRVAERAPGRLLLLATLQQAALDVDPRSRQAQMLAEQSELRLENIDAAHLPSFTLEAQTQGLSDVPTAPLNLPSGEPLFSPPKHTYDATVRINLRIFDPTVSAQASLERAQLAEQQARLRTTLFALRQEVNDAFFAAAAFQQRGAALAVALEDLEARLRETSTRVREGAALPAEAAAVEATLLQRRQEAEEVHANRRAALARLARLTDQPIGDGDELVLPDLSAAVQSARQAAARTRARPEFEQFTRMRERLDRQSAAASAQDRPTVSTFARVGYGRPGLNFINNTFDSYGLGGIEIQWRAWNGGTTGREREALAIQQQIVLSDEEAFARTIARGIETDLAAIDRINAALTLDDRIVVLREQIDRSTRVRLNEGVVTAAEYVDRNSELLQARLGRAAHQVELAQAGARLLTTLGLEVQ